MRYLSLGLSVRRHLVSPTTVVDIGHGPLLLRIEPFVTLLLPCFTDTVILSEADKDSECVRASWVVSTRQLDVCFVSSDEEDAGDSCRRVGPEIFEALNQGRQVVVIDIGAICEARKTDSLDFRAG